PGEGGDEVEGGAHAGPEERRRDEDASHPTVQAGPHHVAPYARRSCDGMEPSGRWTALTARNQRRESERDERETGRHEEECCIAAPRDQRLCEGGTEAVRRHARDAEDGDPFDPARGRDEVGRVGEVGGEERPAHDEVNGGEREERAPGRAHEQEEGQRRRVDGRAPEEHVAPPEAIEEGADRRPEDDARQDARPEDEPDRDLVPTQRAYEEREEEEHAEAHPAREVDRAGEPEGGGVEHSGVAHGSGALSTPGARVSTARAASVGPPSAPTIVRQE